MNCERVRRQLGVYRELDRVERRALAQHLAGCPSCRAAWQEEQQARAVVAGVPRLEPPRGLEGRLLAIPATAGAARPAHPALPWLAIAGLLLLLFGAGLVRKAPVGPGSTGDTVALLVAAPRAAAGEAAPIVRQAAPANPRDDISRAEQAAVLLARAQAPAPAVAVAARQVGLARPARPAATAAPAPAALEPGADVSAAGGGLGSGGDIDTHGERNGTRATRTPASPTEPPPAPTPVPTVCVDITVVAFADLVGGDRPDCPGCDGQWTAEDEAAATAAGVVLPNWPIALYDPLNPDTSSATIIEDELTVNGGQGSYRFTSCAVTLPVRVQLRLRPANDWTVCPTLNTLEQDVTSAGATEVRFPMTLGCPVPTPPPSPTTVLLPDDPAADPTAATPTAAATDRPQPPATPDGSDDPQP